MTTQRPPLTPYEHVAQAKEVLTTGADPKYAIAHAVTAIAEATVATRSARPDIDTLAWLLAEMQWKYEYHVHAYWSDENQSMDNETSWPSLYVVKQR